MIGMLALLALAVAVVWFVQSDDAVTAKPKPVDENPEDREPVDLAQIDVPLEEVPAAERRTLPEGVEPAEAAESEPEPDAAEEVDRRERSTLKIRVEDSFGTPVASALVRATGLRNFQNPGDWRGWTGEGPTDKTDSDGQAELPYPVWESGTGGGWLEVSTVCFTVEHPEFVGLDVEGDVREEEIVVVLQHGSFLIVSGWIESPAERILDVRAKLCYDVEVAEEDWAPLRDGRPSCNRIPPGRHIVALTHERDGITYTSQGTDFLLAEGEQKELHLELLPPRVLTGRLDDRVPRPIEDGEVEVGVQSGTRASGSAVLLHTVKDEIAADGTFSVAGLPPGQLEIIGICAGWSSEMFPSAEDPENLVNAVVPSAEEDDYLLLMRPTSRVELTVLGPNGKPVEDALVYMWPNVQWSVGFSQLFMGRRWNVTTDAYGIALLENLPAKPHESLVVQHHRYQMPLGVSRWGAERRAMWVDLAPGETAYVTLELEEKEE